jgi:hypothetical protein
MAAMIRHIAVASFKEGTSQEQIAEFTERIKALEVDGMLNVTAGPGLALRDGDADYAIAIDFEDEAAFMRYHDDATHGALRAGLAADIIEHSSACQIQL